MRSLVYVFVVFFFFKQKTAYEMRISDWSSDVCSSDLHSSPFPLAMGRERRDHGPGCVAAAVSMRMGFAPEDMNGEGFRRPSRGRSGPTTQGDRKSTRLNSSH